MKKLTKRVLSLMLAVIMAMPVMLITPFSAFATASPNKEVKVREYLTSSDNLGNVRINDGNHVWWDDNKGGLWFDGNNAAWCDLTDNPFTDITPESGVTFSVDVYRDSGCPQWGRVFDFSNGDKNSNYFMLNMGSGSERFLMATKFDGGEIKYWSDGTGQGNNSGTIFKKKIDGNYANFRNGIADNTWYNIKVTLCEVGGIGRMYIWFNGEHYYTYLLGNDYVELISKFKDYNTFYLGDSVFNDPNLKGCIRNLRIYKGTDDDTVKLSEWSFDNTFDDINGQNAFTLGDSSSNRYGFYDNNHIYFSDNGNWGYANAPSKLRDGRYNKNWRTDLEFNFVEGKIVAENTPILGITNKSDVNTSYNGNQSFGVARNGDVYLKGNVIGNIDFDINGLYNNNEKYRMLLSYAYHNGVVDVLINHQLRKSFDVRNSRDLFENAHIVTVGGCSNKVTSMDLWDLAFYSYQDNDGYENHLKARYFTSNNLTQNAVSNNYGLTTNGSGAEWVNIDGKQAAHFLGGDKNNYLYLNKSNTKALFENADFNSGITFSFEGKGAVDNAWQRFFELSNVSSGYGGGDANKFLFFAPQKDTNDAAYNGYGTAKVGLGGYQAGDVHNVSDITNWHIWTFSVYQGMMVIYKDGEKVQTVASPGMNQDWFKELLTNNGLMLFGASTYNLDPGFTGWMRDFRIYDIALDDDEVEVVYNEIAGKNVSSSEFASIKSELEAACSAYETKMRNMDSTTYTNTKAAYEAYVVANRYIDSITYGEPDDMLKGNAKRAIYNLKNETAKIGTFEKARAANRPAWYYNNSGKKRTNFDTPYTTQIMFSNILYASDVYTPSLVMSDYHNIQTRMFYPETLVWLYDGVNDLRTPVGTTVKRNSGGISGYNRQLRWLYPCVSTTDDGDNSQVDLIGNWLGRGSNGETVDFMWSFLQQGNKSSIGHNSYTEVSSGNMETSYWCFGNVLRYKGGNFSENGKEFSVPWRSRDNNSSSKNEDTNDKIYILNYKKITDNIGTAQSKVSTAGDSIANFKEGEASALINAYDAATSFDPNSYFKSGDMRANFTTCKNDLGTIVSGLSTAAPANDRNYESLRELMAAKKADYANNGAALRETYTTTSVNNFVSKYNDAKAHMAALKDNNYNTGTANTLYNALNGVTLDRRADVSKLNSEYAEADGVLKALNSNETKYTADSVQALVNAVSAAGESKYIGDVDTSDMGQKDNQSIIDNLESNIKNATLVEAPVISEETLTGYEEAYAKITTNIDPDAFDSTSQSISTAKNVAETLFPTIEYGGVKINVVDKNATNQNVDAAIETMLTSLTNSVKEYEITRDGDFDINFRNGKSRTDSETGKVYATYGTTIVAESEDDNTAWYYSYRAKGAGLTDQFQGYGKRVTLKVYGETTVKGVKRTGEQKQVKIIRNYFDIQGNKDSKEPVTLVAYVNANDNFTLPDFKAYPFYQFDGYYVGGTKYNAGDKVAISEDTVVVAKYIENADSSCAISVAGGTITPADSIAYNDRVSIKGKDGTYAWIEATNEANTEFRPFYIGKDASFYASESTYLKAVTEEQFNAYNFSLPTINLRKGGAIKNDGETRTVFNAQIVYDSEVYNVDDTSDGAGIKEYGILIGAAIGENGHLPNETELLVENTGTQTGYKILRAKSTKLVGANQFTISVNKLPNSYAYRGYVIYKDKDGKMHTVYTDAR